MNKSWLGAVLAAASLIAASAAAEPVALAGTAFETVDAGTRKPLRYYLAAPADATRPALVVIQGSGCEPVFVVNDGAATATAGQDLIQSFTGGRFAVMIVEKPGVEGAAAARTAGEVSNACSQAFRRRHTLDAWTDQIGRAIDHARKTGLIDRRAGVRLLGLSEGAVVAARVAARREDVSHVTFISGFGCDQWSDMLVRARLDAENPAAAVAAVEDGLRMVAADPENPDAFFEGQTHLFWSTFGKACPAADLAQSNAKLLVYYGTEDEQIDANGVEAITAARIAAGKDVRVERIYGGGHILNTPASEPFEILIGAFRDSIDWMAPENAD